MNKGRPLRTPASEAIDSAERRRAKDLLFSELRYIGEKAPLFPRLTGHLSWKNSKQNTNASPLPRATTTAAALAAAAAAAAVPRRRFLGGIGITT